MTNEELAEIKWRNDTRRERCTDHPPREHDSVLLCLTCDAQQEADVDALLAEVERLSRALRREYTGVASSKETAEALGIEPL